jgi:hypothetical protein
MTVVAFAGRRVDAAFAQTPRFPVTSIDMVAARIRHALRTLNASVLVASAAAGADLLALREAGALGLRRRVVLPVTPGEFVADSVADRPGEWATLFDTIIADAERTGNLVVLRAGGGYVGYVAVTDAIIAETRAIADAMTLDTAALVAWDGRPRGDDDLTDVFRQHATASGLVVHEIDTLGR